MKLIIKKIIYTSTGGGRYGNPHYLPLDEKHPVDPLSPYGISKHSAEHYVKTYSELYGIDYLIFCFGNVYGPRDNPLAKRIPTLFSYQLLKDEETQIFGDGEQTRDFIFVLDLVEFISNSIEKTPEHKLFNLASGTQVNVNQIYEKLKNVAGSDKAAVHVSAVKGEVRDVCLDIALARKELGWNPSTQIDEGLKQTFYDVKKTLGK